MNEKGAEKRNKWYVDCVCVCAINGRRFSGCFVIASNYLISTTLNSMFLFIKSIGHDGHVFYGLHHFYMVNFRLRPLIGANFFFCFFVERRMFFLWTLWIPIEHYLSGIVWPFNFNIWSCVLKIAFSSSYWFSSSAFASHHSSGLYHHYHLTAFD